MNSVISTHSQQQFKRPSLLHLSESSKEDISKAEASRILSDKFQRRGVETDYSLKSDIMYNRGNKPGTNIGFPGDKANNRNSSGFQQHQSPNNSALTFAAGRDLVHGTTGLLLGSQTAQQNSSALAAQTALARQQQQHQFLRAQSKTNPLETFKMASNLQEQLLIKRQLESIKQELHQREASKLRAEFQIKAASQVSPVGIGRSILSGATKHIPSTSNSSVVPTKQREDEMTKPDLSTLADTAVAVATATSARNNTGMLGMGGVMKTNSSNITGNNQIAALLGRRDSSSAASKESMQSSFTSSQTNRAMTDILRRDLGVTRGKLHLGQNYKRSLDEMSKSTAAPSPASSSWLWKSAGLGNATLSMAELRAQHEQLQRRNSLPARPSSTTSDFASIRSLKRQKLIDEKVKEIERLEIQDAMKRMRQLDSKLDMRVHNNTSLLAEMASKIASQERRASFASSVASVGTSATAPNLSTTSSALTSPVDRRSLIMAESSLDERSKILEKLSRLSGGFPMPRSANTAVGIQNNVPAEITPEVGKDVVDVMGRGSLSLKHQLETVNQSRLGGFPMPPLYMHTDENQAGQFDGTMNISEPRSNNAISSHIRNNVNRGSAKVTQPPTLQSYKRAWSEIRVIAGVDPRVDERIRKEVFARKLQRGDIFVGKTGTIVTNNINNRFIQQRRLSDMSLASGSGNTGGRTQGTGGKAEDSIII